MAKVTANDRWRKVLKQFIRSEMTKKGIDYKMLSGKLAAVGVEQSPDNLRAKINRGILGGQLLLQLVLVMDVRALDARLIREILDSSDQSHALPPE